ncbi:PspC domain-containing protein [Actinomadura madurae]|uniref:PspC domain-containing protein n=1 Tax=Actinomadura madurae TaxID=1993 RepID=UPI0020D22553|nr:PspC domain-containing protein [Actinomadura madurae]MCP9969877.1 PspC domain-containing protein [Actinomadura madurae]
MCRGLAAHLGVDAFLVRAAFVLLTLASGLGVAAYAAFWILVPVAEKAGPARPGGGAATGASCSRTRRSRWASPRCRGAPPGSPGGRCGRSSSAGSAPRSCGSRPTATSGSAGRSRCASGGCAACSGCSSSSAASAGSWRRTWRPTRRGRSSSPC